MRKVAFLCTLFLLSGLFSACDDQTSSEPPAVEVDKQRGMTSISKDGLTISVLSEFADTVTYDNVRKEFLITNNTDQTEYWAKGETNSRIRFSPSCKESAVLILNGVKISTNSGSSPVLWESDLNKLEVKAQKGTDNFLTATKDDVPAIESVNNLDIGGGGVFYLSSKNASCINCDKITLKGTGTINVNSDGKHGIKCKSFESKEKTTYVCNISATKCGIKCDGNVNKQKGNVNILSGSIRINNYGEYGIYATSNLNIGDSENYAFVTINTTNEETALHIEGTKTKDGNGSSFKINGKEVNF